MSTPLPWSRFLAWVERQDGRLVTMTGPTMRALIRCTECTSEHDAREIMAELGILHAEDLISAWKASR